MQLYTKILIGMAVGALVGLLLGPNSLFLTHDVYAIRDASQIVFQQNPADASSRVQLPAGVPLQMRLLETTFERHPDLLGEEREVPVWSKVRFPFSQRLALADPSDRIRQQLGVIAPGGSVEGWLQISRTPLEVGGFAFSPRPISRFGEQVITILRPIGQVFMRLIRMVVVPLVFASLLVGVASLGDIRKLGRLGSRTLGLYLGTTAVAVSIGLVCAYVVQPGQFIDPADRTVLLAQFGAAAGDRMSAAAVSPSMVDTLLAVIPTNPIDSLTSGNMLQIIFFAIVLGVAITALGPEENASVVTLFEKLQNAMIVIIGWVMALAPYGVAALIAEVIGTSGISVLTALLVYGATVVLGLAIHGGIVYGGLVRLLSRLSWISFMRAARPAQLIAFSTSSSSATLPVSIECAEKNIGVSNPVASFVLPLGSTVNMDGTALYQGVAAIFIAQVFQTDLSFGSQLGIVLAATMASIGAAGVPGAGIITLALVLTSTGIPTVGLALILGVDRILDMFRTAVNVTGDLAITTVMAKSEGERLTLESSA
jgi:Na+/H+-dicarboxylate symporter